MCASAYIHAHNGDAFGSDLKIKHSFGLKNQIKT